MTIYSNHNHVYIAILAAVELAADSQYLYVYNRPWAENMSNTYCVSSCDIDARAKLHDHIKIDSDTYRLVALDRTGTWVEYTPRPIEEVRILLSENRFNQKQSAQIITELLTVQNPTKSNYINMLSSTKYYLESRGNKMTLVKEGDEWAMYVVNASVRAWRRGYAIPRYFASLDEVEKKYKTWRGISQLATNPQGELN